MIIDKGMVRNAIMSFMESRCDVSSQHKLPSREEILSTAFASMIGEGLTSHAIDQLISTGKIRRYGPYLSDREIDTL